jgi:hypothetical protein
MKKINKNTEYAALYLYQTQKMDAATIAKELKVSKETVEEILNNQQPEKPKKTIVKDLMIRQTSSKGTNSVAIMTHAASQQADESTKTNINSPTQDPPHIFRPNG